MVEFLRAKGYKVVPVTQALVSNASSRNVTVNVIKKNHVLLMMQLYHKNEASWTVCHKGQLIHNFFVSRIYPFEFVNRPILAAYLIFHESWKK